MKDFKFKTKPFAQQLECFNLSKDKKIYAYFMDAGTGKSKIAIDVAAYLKIKKEIDFVIIIATNNVHLKWVNKEIPEHCPIKYDAFAVNTPEYKLKKDFMFDFSEDSDMLPFISYNYDILGNKNVQAYIRKLCAKLRVFMIVDESHKIRNIKNIATKFLHDIANLPIYKRIMTGTPTGNDQVLDLYSQYYFLSPKIINASSFWAFKNTYAVWQKIVLNPTEVARGLPERSFKKRLGLKNKDKLLKKIAPYTYTKKKKDVHDMPDKNYMTYPVKITPLQERLYNDMLANGVFKYEDNSFISETRLTDIGKAQEILSGFFQHPFEENIVEIVKPDKNPKWQAVLDILEDYDRKIIIWSRSVYEIEQLTKLIAKRYKNNEIVEMFYGKIDDKERMETIKRFQTKEYPKFLVANQDCNIEGLDMFAADTAIYLTNSFSWINRSQSEDRIHRIGQKNNCMYIDIVVPGSTDLKILKILKDCRDISEDVYKELVGNSLL